MMNKEIKPGQKTKLTRTGRPIMVLLELLGQKQTLRILWELRDGPSTFRALQEKCGGISPTILNRRLSEMRAAGIVYHQQKEGYQLGEDGHELLTMLEPLRGWAERWAIRTSVDAP